MICPLPINRLTNRDSERDTVTIHSAGIPDSRLAVAVCNEKAKLSKIFIQFGKQTIRAIRLPNP